MPITPVNQTKHSITPANSRISQMATWGDSFVTWGSAILFWGSPTYNVTNTTKHSITPVNQTKN